MEISTRFPTRNYTPCQLCYLLTIELFLVLTLKHSANTQCYIGTKASYELCSKFGNETLHVAVFSSPFLATGDTLKVLNIVCFICLIIITQNHYYSTFSNVQCLEPLIKPAIISATHLWVLSWESATSCSKWGWRTGKKASSKFLKRPCKTEKCLQ